MRKNLPPNQISIRLTLSLITFFSLTISAHAASLSVSPAAGDLTDGTSLDIFAEVETGKTAAGVDVVLTFDASMVLVNQITNGDLEVYTLKNIDEAAGVIRISAINSSNSAFTGQIKVATLEVSPVAQTGTTALSFVFEDGSGDGSHIPDSATGGDLLISGTDGSYTLLATFEAGTGSPGGEEVIEETAESTAPATGSPSPLAFYTLLASGLILSGLTSLKRATAISR